MCDAKHDERKHKTRRAPESDVEQAGDQKRNADRCLHSALAFAGKPARNDWSNSRADTTRCKEHADSGRGAFADRKNAFAKHSEEGEYAAAESPRRFDE